MGVRASPVPSVMGKSAKIGRFGFQGFEKQKKLAKHASTYGGPAQPSIGERKPADKARKQAGAIGKKKPKSGAKAGKKERRLRGDGDTIWRGICLCMAKTSEKTLLIGIYSIYVRHFS
ncbi:hypothetical protein EMIHUDRAFT_207693 [Emiliania huxleyi CCMP1516]|uniref:Uncharacterized protein n=2 Tax=Emiliania huxleyi TaxID=2903 RepID=A0A0D3JDU7_EMIH1|nr:hypothetical protein EMIHUDRAFT_207693 [Emiliania huxleyi CCMP1516]EOD21682.1 hypothetical protein EMIHUDRAFT_207693 [Emiliania huxleyi CCMP1516]|eukprot:XP_005774111.1 hypothetical protein EMIHUDRAFT_207693 [Emiliania huxleyi CCMP1516]